MNKKERHWLAKRRPFKDMHKAQRGSVNSLEMIWSSFGARRLWHSHCLRRVYVQMLREGGKSEYRSNTEGTSGSFKSESIPLTRVSVE